MTISAFSGRPRTVINIRLNKRETSPSKPHIHILHSGRKCGSYFQRQRKITITFYVLVLLEECNGRGWPQSADSLSPYVQRWAKRWTCFAMQQPGRGRLKFLATLGPPFNFQGVSVNYNYYYLKTVFHPCFLEFANVKSINYLNG